MIIFYIVLFFLALPGCKFSGKEFFHEESFSKDVTTSVKGVFIWLVFLSHFSSYVQYENISDIFGVSVSVFLGQSVVACFLCYSGFGVFESYKKKGLDYARTMPKNRILKTLFHFNVALLLFLIIQILRGKNISPLHIALSSFGWASLGNSNWYIFVILSLYLITWLSFICMKDNIFKAGIMTTILSVVLLLFLICTRSTVWYDTILCYVLGIWLSVYKEKFIAFITKNNSIWTMAGIISVACFGLFRVCDHFVNSALEIVFKLPAAPVFALAVIIFLFKFKVSNKILMFSGKHLFEIYILQRIPMILFKVWGVSEFNLYLYFILCLLSTVILAIVFRYLTDKIDAVLFKTKSITSIL